jgi:hypothetical protein
VEQQQQQNSSLQLQNPTDYRYSGEKKIKKSSKFQLLSAPKIPNSKLLQALWKTQFAKPIIKFFRRELLHGEKRKLELCSYKTKVCLFPHPQKKLRNKVIQFRWDCPNLIVENPPFLSFFKKIPLLTQKLSVSVSVTVTVSLICQT